MKYRVDVHIRRRKEMPFEFHEFKSEDFDDLEEYCQSVASYLMECIKDNLDGDEDESDSN